MAKISLQVSRRWLLAGYGLLLGVAFLIPLIFSLIWLSSKQSDHLAVIANFLTLGTLVVALIAGFVALQAYAVATGPPDLKLKVSFPFSHPNQPAFPAPKGQKAPIPANQQVASIYLYDQSRYPAKNPAVVVRLNGMVIGPSQFSSGQEWKAIEFYSTQGIKALRWDGPSFSVHGSSQFRLPRLIMQGLTYGPEESSFTFEILADGYRRLIEVPVEYVLPTHNLSDARMPEWI